MQVAIFIPCFIDQLYPEVGRSMVELLRRQGFALLYNGEHTCCGQPAFNAGFRAEAARVGAKWLRDAAAWSNLPIVCPSASCVGYLRKHLAPQLDPAQTGMLAGLRELSEFLVEQGRSPGSALRFPHRVAYHHACSALNECNNRQAPLQLLRQVRDLQLIEPPDAEVCCGFGGSFSIKFEPISVAMAEKKVENALQAGAEYLVSTDMSCLMHLQGYISRRRLPLRTAHLAQILTGNA